MVLIYILKYLFFIYRLYKLTKNESDKNIENLKESAIQCGPLAIKLLQMIIMGNYGKIIKSCDKLHFVFEDCESHSFEDTSLLYFKDFKKKIFEDYELALLIGSGSIGQVYKAYSIKRKEYVAIKVKHPEINNIVNKTVFSLRIVCFFTKYINKFHSIMIEYINNIYLQTNYITEAKNTKKIKYNFRNENCIIVPEVFHYSENFIIMSYHEGKKYNEVSEHVQTVASMYMNFFYMSSLVIHDFVHADLHFGNWKICENGNEIKLIIYDCGIVCSSDDLEFNKEILKYTLNRKNFIKILDVIQKLEPNRNIEIYKPQFENLVSFNISSSECLSLFLQKLNELKLIQNKKLINLLGTIAIIGDTPNKSISIFTKYIYSNLDINTILYHVYFGMLTKINEFNELKEYFQYEIENGEKYIELYNNWLMEEFGHKNGNILNTIIHNKFFPHEF